MSNHTDVFIVGAGPSGLTLASLLTYYGISCRIIDKYPAPLVLSKAAAIHARTLEIFDVLDISDKMIAEGNTVNILGLNTLQKESLRFDFSLLENTRYPYIMMFPQYRTEELLIDRLAELGVNVERQKELIDFMPIDEGVSATIVHDDGTKETATATYLIGADGAKSTVRHLLGLDFDGDDYGDPWVLVDAKLAWDIPRNEMTFSSNANGICGVFPLSDHTNEYYRIAYTQNHDANGAPIEPSVEDAQNMLGIVGVEGQIQEIISKFWVFNLQHRQVEQYRHGQVLLLGDAAHIHTPFGGQGLNLGVVDAFNLAWKLAMVVKGQSSERLLDSYQEERHPIGEQVVRATHIGASAMLLRKPSIKRSVREFVMPIMNSVTPVKRRMVNMMSQLAHHYKDATTVRGQDGNLRAGERLPNYPYVDMSGTTDLYAQLDNTKHTLLMVGNTSDLHDLAKIIQTNYASTVVPRIIDTQPVSDAPCPIIADISGLIPLKPNLAYLIRPDQMIGLVSTIAEMRAGAQELFG